VATALGLNVDLAETLALAHDIGHPPFGHAGERALNACLQRYALQFDHNLHALRIVEHFEQRYAGHRGLNLTLATREGIIKHSRDYDESSHPELAAYLLDKQPPLEAQIIDLADEIAYLTADLDDGVESGLLEIDHIIKHVGILRRSYDTVRQAHPNAEEKYIFHDALQSMQKALVLDLVGQIGENVLASKAKSLDEIRAQRGRVAKLSPKAEAERAEGKQYLYDTLYTCPLLEQEHAKAETVVTELFEFWLHHPDQLPESYALEIETDGVPRVAADYIAGMTDHFILQQHAEARAFVRSGGSAVRFG
jgi:dGTPase